LYQPLKANGRAGWGASGGGRRMKRCLTI